MRLRMELLLRRRRSVLASFLAIALVGALLPLLGATPARAQTYMEGIDVSHHQGTIDWNSVAESGQRYVFQKATEGATFTDGTYVHNRAGAGAASLPFGAYHFAYAQGGSLDAARADAISEASYFLQVAKPEPGDLLPVLDLEKNPQGMPPARLIAWTQAWLDTVESALGVKPLIYTNPNFWATHMNDTAIFAQQGFPLWIAHYTTQPAPRVPAGNWDGRGWAFWQFTSCATIPGISGCVDQNRYPATDLSPYTIPGAPEPEPTPDPATPPSNETPPAISGVTEVGRTLSASSGTWSGSEPLAYSYAWYRCGDETGSCTGIVGGTEPTYDLKAADAGHRMKVAVTATNSAGSGEAESELTAAVAERPPPPAPPELTHPRRARVLAPTVEVKWTAPDAAAAYDARYRSAPKNGRFGSFTRIATNVTATSVSVELSSGHTYCFSARAKNEAGAASPWSIERCTHSPLDDRDLRAFGRWRERTNDNFYRDTLTMTKRRGAVLVIGRARMRDIHVVAQRCPGCGRIAVLFNGDRVARISLAAKRFRNQRVLHAASFPSTRRGKVKLRVISRGKPVRIDGLALTFPA